MSESLQVRVLLQRIAEQMQALKLWQAHPPAAEAFESGEPFCIDVMHAEEWLQWVFLPRMLALLEAEQPLPTRFAITPYFEEAWKHRLNDDTQGLLQILQQLDELLDKETAH